MTELERKIILRALACQMILTTEANRKVEAYVTSTEENEFFKYTGNELTIHIQLMELRKQELKEYEDVFASLKGRVLEPEARDPIEVPEPIAYERGFRYGCDPTSTSDGASTPEGQPYLWNLYFHWLMEVRCENATMARFKKGFLDGVLALSINKGE
tara:strand:- start:375 stop:845 length:471 start_codon:yes stop_codon:yes gene_type:complete